MPLHQTMVGMIGECQVFDDFTINSVYGLGDDLFILFIICVKARDTIAGAPMALASCTPIFVTSEPVRSIMTCERCQVLLIHLHSILYFFLMAFVELHSYRPSNGLLAIQHCR